MLEPRIIAFATTALAVMASAVASAQSLAVKRLYAPPADVEAGVVVLPPPSAGAVASQHALLVAPRAGVANAGFGFVAAPGLVRVAPLGHDAMRWVLEADGVDGPMKLVGEPLAEGAPLRRVARMGERIVSQAPLGSGEPTRSIEWNTRGGVTEVGARVPADGSREVALVVDDASEATLVVHAASWIHRAGEPMRLEVAGRLPLARGAGPLGDPTLAERAAAGQPLAVANLSAEARWSDGTRTAATVVGGARGDAALVFDRPPAGDGTVFVHAEVLLPDGHATTRTAQLLVRVEAGTTALLDRACALLSPDARWLEVRIPVDTERDALFAGCELWARGTHGERCLGWIGGISDIVRGNGAAYASIGCERAHAQLEPDETLELRRIRVHARDGFAPLDLRDTIALDAPHDALRAPATAPIAGPFGIPGVAQIATTASEGFVPGPGSHVLVLAHGYCAGSNPWPLAQFGADAAPYTNPNQNLSHDAFALDISAAAAQFKSFGLVAHSQGGCAGLHLYTFYWSGLDWAGAGRLIQCVGSPFEGTPMAGNLAALGEVFGVQCGANNDMTPAGSTAWLSTIPSAARAAVYTHTTTFTDNWWSFDYCNIVTDAFLSDPEDGVVEHSAGHFPGANDMGIKTGWCHVSGMRDPAQTGDSARNGVMNAQGAR